MELKNLIVDTKSTWVEFPGLDGFEVELANLSRKEPVSYTHLTLPTICSV